MGAKPNRGPDERELRIKRRNSLWSGERGVVEPEAQATDLKGSGSLERIVLKCLVRLRDMGLRRAYITGYSPEAIALYGSLGAEEGTESLIYRQTMI